MVILRIWESSYLKLPLLTLPSLGQSHPCEPFTSPSSLCNFLTVSLKTPATLCPTLLQPVSLLHPDPCYSPLGLAGLAEGSLHASSQQLEHPTQAALMGAPTQEPRPHGWHAGGHAYAKWHTRPHYLQLDLLQPRNLTGQ